MSSRVTKKNSSRRPELMSYEGYDYGQNKETKIFLEVERQFIPGYKMEYGILFYSIEDDILFIK